LRILGISAETLHIWLNSDTHMGYFTWRPKHVFIVKSCTKYFVARHQSKGRALLYSHGNAEHFILSTAAYRPTTIKRKHSNNGYANAPRCYVVCLEEVPSSAVRETFLQKVIHRPLIFYSCFFASHQVHCFILIPSSSVKTLYGSTFNGMLRSVDW
jgi:hypothetical protein